MSTQWLCFSAFRKRSSASCLLTAASKRVTASSYGTPRRSSPRFSYPLQFRSCRNSRLKVGTVNTVNAYSFCQRLAVVGLVGWFLQSWSWPAWLAPPYCPTPPYTALHRPTPPYTALCGLHSPAHVARRAASHARGGRPQAILGAAACGRAFMAGRLSAMLTCRHHDTFSQIRHVGNYFAKVERTSPNFTRSEASQMIRTEKKSEKE